MSKWKQCVPFIAIMSNDFELLIKCTNVFFQSLQSCKKYKTCFFECKSCNLYHFWLIVVLLNFLSAWKQRSQTCLRTWSAVCHTYFNFNNLTIHRTNVLTMFIFTVKSFLNQDSRRPVKTQSVVKIYDYAEKLSFYKRIDEFSSLLVDISQTNEV